MLVANDYELLPRNFTSAPGVVVPADGYDYATRRVSYTLGTQRTISACLLRYNVDAHSLNSSIRLRWEYTGGSE